MAEGSRGLNEIFGGDIREMLDPKHSRVQGTLTSENREVVTREILQTVISIGHIPEDWLYTALTIGLSPIANTPDSYHAHRIINNDFAQTALSLARQFQGMDTPGMQLVSLLYITDKVTARHAEFSEKVADIDKGNKTFTDTEKFTAQQNQERARTQAQENTEKLALYLPQLQEAIEKFAQHHWGEQKTTYVKIARELISMHKTFSSRRDGRVKVREEIIQLLGKGKIDEAKAILEANTPPLVH